MRVRLESNGRYWLARWTDDAGKPRGKSLGAKSSLSKRAALKACARIADEHARTPAKRNIIGAPTLGGWLDEFRTLTPTYSAVTRALYDRTSALLQVYFGTERRIDRISRADAKSWRAWLYEVTYKKGKEGEGRRLTESTIRKHIRNAKVIFGLAGQCDYIPINPFDREQGAPLPVDKTWAYISLDDLAKLLHACPSRPWRSLLAICRLAGLRLGEALRLRWADIDWEINILTVQHEGEQTTKKRKRQVPMVPQLQTELAEAMQLAEEGQTRVCPLRPLNLHRNMRAIVRRAGMQPWSKLFHTLRKNCESDWLARYPVMAVCEWLGHDPTVAFKHYHKAGADLLAAVTGKAQTDDVEALKARIAQLEAMLAQQTNVR